MDYVVASRDGLFFYLPLTSARVMPPKARLKLIEPVDPAGRRFVPAKSSTLFTLELSSPSLASLLPDEYICVGGTLVQCFKVVALNTVSVELTAGRVSSVRATYFTLPVPEPVYTASTIECSEPDFGVSFSNLDVSDAERLSVTVNFDWRVYEGFEKDLVVKRPTKLQLELEGYFAVTDPEAPIGLSASLSGACGDALLSLEFEGQVYGIPSWSSGDPAGRARLSASGFITQITGPA